MMTETTLIMLHGFLGNHHDFDDVVAELPEYIKNKCVSLDLPGHNNKEPASYRETIQILNEEVVSRNIGDFVIYGYSLGGNIALDYAFKQKNPALKGLILESGAFGITDEERKIREGSDLMWAAKFAIKRPEEVLDEWYGQSKFAGLTPKQKQALINKRKSQDFHKLAQQFRLTTVAHLENYRGRIAELPINVAYLYGALDTQFCKVAEREKATAKNFIPLCIENASHNVHTFFPKETASVIAGIWEKLTIRQRCD